MGRTLADLQARTAAHPAPDRRARSRGRPQGAARRHRRQGTHAGRTVGADPAGGPPPGRQPDEGGHHRPGLLRRLAAAGHPRRRPHRRAGRAPHRQRADRRGPRLRPGPAQDRHRRRLRPRRRHVRLLDPVDPRRRVQGAQHQRRHLPRRRRLRPGPHGSRRGRRDGHRSRRRATRNCSSTCATQAERTKIALSSAETAEFALDLPDRGVHYRRTFTRAEFEALLRPLIDRSARQVPRRPARRAS